ncbi:MAG TPA: phage major capsid protein [Fimbriiglobus sp.]|jgi:HK97 family phage major capsid protein
MSAIAVPDKFQTRDELVSFIEETVEKAVPYAATRVDRRVPWVTAGPIYSDSAGYSVLKAAAFALGYVGAEQAKEEVHTHTQLRDLYAGYGFSPHHGQQSFLVPLASAHLPVFEPQGSRLRTELHQKMTAQAGKFDPDEAGWLNRRLRVKALGTVDDAAGGTFVPLPMLGELIDLQRNLEAFAAAGAQEIALPPNGRVQFPKLTGGSTAYWVGEGNPITESTPGTGNLDLQAKKLGVLVKLNNELLRFASPSAEGLVRFDMARAAALKADLAMLEGTGGTQIKGLLTYTGLGSHTATTTGANGDTFQPQDVALMEATLPDAVDAPTAWLMRKAMYAALMNRRADAVSAADGKGAFLFRGSSAASNAPPADLYGTRVVRSSQVSGTRTKGSGTDLSYVLLGYFPDWIVARMGVMEFLASGHGDTAITNDQTVLRGIQHVDAGPRHPASFVLCDQLIVE